MTTACDVSHDESHLYALFTSFTELSEQRRDWRGKTVKYGGDKLGNKQSELIVQCKMPKEAEAPIVRGMSELELPINLVYHFLYDMSARNSWDEPAVLLNTPAQLAMGGQVDVLQTEEGGIEYLEKRWTFSLPGGVAILNRSCDGHPVDPGEKRGARGKTVIYGIMLREEDGASSVHLTVLKQRVSGFEREGKNETVKLVAAMEAWFVTLKKVCVDYLLENRHNLTLVQLPHMLCSKDREMTSLRSPKRGQGKSPPSTAKGGVLKGQYSAAVINQTGEGTMKGAMAQLRAARAGVPPSGVPMVDGEFVLPTADSDNEQHPQYQAVLDDFGEGRCAICTHPLPCKHFDVDGMKIPEPEPDSGSEEEAEAQEDLCAEDVGLTDERFEARKGNGG